MLDTQIAALFSFDAFRRLLLNEPVSLIQFNIMTDALVARNIPFDVSFVSGTRKQAAALQLTVHINPSATMVFVVALEPGSTTFAPSP
jgi:hypothetical protein